MKEYISNLIKSEITALDEKAKRDYKAEYKKFQSSTKAKKYRAELNKYNRQKGTYGNGDKKDASHKGGKIVGFESQSKNRGRAEKSRLKKEDLKRLVKTYGVERVLEACQKGYMTHPTRKTKIMFGKRYRNCVKKEDTLPSPSRKLVKKMKKKGNTSVPYGSGYKKVNENEKQKILKLMIKYGDNPKDAKKALSKHYKKAKGDRSKATPSQLAQYIGYLSANESVNEKMRPAVKKLLKQKGYSPIFQAIDNSKRQFKQMRYSRGEIQDTLIDMFGDEDPKILQKIKESVNEAKYKGYDYRRQSRKKGLPLIVPALRKTFSNMKDLKKYIDKHGTMESVNEYTYGVGDIVKDINPTCPHNGAMGKVKSVSPKSVVFVVMNKGKNYQPGDVLDKTHDQMKKMNEISNSEAKTLLKQLGGRRFMMMVGAKGIARDKDGLHMKIGRNSKSISHVVIDYNRGRDLYDMKFLRVRKSGSQMKVKTVKHVKGIYADQLHDTFEKHTGLYTRM